MILKKKELYKKNISAFMNRKSIIIAIRTIGYLYLIAMLINTIFFYDKYLYETFLSTHLFGVIDFFMITYKCQDHKKEKGLIKKFFDKIDDLFSKIKPLR
ncbi:hypothetical protein [Anaerobium acetethylicum]|uniref:Uncharacterized protein n=1 Tax=Anaerobium acetethylicum TaxID=1619234 RepID=A0A1D3TSN1_9FIRM|nr:hypothetical protein [Anaerobium acetethylicum]SCP96869.1 hypothetical protein SAMN05421730_10074 [Anaerobium acetethylicum]